MGEQMLTKLPILTSGWTTRGRREGFDEKKN